MSVGSHIFYRYEIHRQMKGLVSVVWASFSSWFAFILSQAVNPLLAEGCGSRRDINRTTLDGGRKLRSPCCGPRKLIGEI